MTLSFCVLGSGSGGNATIVMCGNASPRAMNETQSSSPRRDCILIDCGLSPRAVNRRMEFLGRTIEDIAAILITHFDTDHFYSSWQKVIEKRNMPVVVHRRHRAAAWRAGLTARHAALFKDSIQLDCGVQASGLLLAHDEHGSVGYVIEHADHRLGYATDLGRVPGELLDFFGNVDAVAIESNYDRHMQLNSGRPAFLKQRIMGGSGHLSNAQSLEAVYRLVETTSLSHIALLHLSRECNDPSLVRRLYGCEAPHLLERLTISNQHAPSPLMAVEKIPQVHSYKARGESHRLIANGPQMRLFS